MRPNLFLIALIASFNAFSQILPRCGFSEAQNYLMNTDPLAKSKIHQALQGFEENSGSQNKLTQAAVYTIPVVFHIIHLGGDENISDAQIQNALDILNRDFNKQNADTVNIVGAFQTIASDCQIEFKLAQVDENGNCSTGITRHYDQSANWTISSSYYKYTWNRTRYLNIYVVKSLPSGIGAYTFLPGTASANMDAVVILHGLVGEIGTSHPFGSRSLTHEVGHWLNLQHTWGYNNQPGVACGDDGVGDTPVTKGFSFCNLANAAVCASGVEENVQNYMEYAFCSNMFTLGQRNRMHNALNSANAGRINLWSAANLQFTGVFNSPLPCPPKADFACSREYACVGDSVNFIDFSYGGAVSNWTWSSTSANNSSALQNGKLVFNQSGAATVQLRVSSAAGSDSIFRRALLILSGANSGSLSLVQGFETSPFPDAFWVRTEPEYGSAFQSQTTAPKSGSSGLWVNNFFDTPSEPVSFFSPAYKFQSFLPATLSFHYAYAQKASDSEDELRVYASVDCGQTWMSIFDLKGSNLSTVPGPSNTAFFPSAQQYSMASVDLSNFHDQDFHLKFTFTPDPQGPGNNVFLDDILLSGVTALSETVKDKSWNIFPNPSKGELYIRHSESSGTMTLRFMDLTGREILELKHFDSQSPLVLPSDLSDGFYVLELLSNSGKELKKVLICR